MPNELIPGRNAVEEALRAGRRLLHIVVSRDSEVARSPLIKEARRRNIQVRFADRSALDSLVGRGRHQGIVAVAEARPPASLDDIFEEAKKRGEPPFIAILDGVEDPQNLGAVIRSAESFGVHGIILPERRSAGVSPAVHKASAGAVEYMRIVRVTNLPHALSLCRGRGLWIIGAESRGDKSLFSEDLKGPVAFVIGGEDTGLSRPVAERCDRIVRVPMSGRVRSLNVSAAAAILLFEKRRQEAAAGAQPAR
ncbi:MAG: 23S rRNA (guanosine(2251)-2'-O)-methyltransferase RlmB [Euryarchaeota archaeon]|nr:23S rRNA (guanosine(2251)-2'-O)-methyltransferase RlmB [Euryarchaeota archaeon]